MGCLPKHYWLDITDWVTTPTYAVLVPNPNATDAEQVAELTWLRDEIRVVLGATVEPRALEHLYVLWRELNGCIERMK